MKRPTLAREHVGMAALALVEALHIPIVNEQRWYLVEMALRRAFEDGQRQPIPIELPGINPVRLTP